MADIRKQSSWFLVIITFLSGCASRHLPYEEPDPTTSEVARLRVVALPGIRVSVLSYPPGNTNCVHQGDARELAVESNMSGFKLGYSKKLGMPVKNPVSEKWGSEFYIRAGAPLTLEMISSGSNGFFTGVCDKAFQFLPESGRNYELHSFAGVRGREAICEILFLDISDPSKATSVPVRDVYVAKPDIRCPAP